MALPKLFQRIFWHNNTTPAIQEDNLNAMSKGLSDVDDRLIALAGTIMEDVPQIQEDLEILEPAIENIDSNVERAETAADDAEDSAETAEYWANVSNPPIPVVKDFASVISVDDAIPKAATDVKVKVEAIQDLHGFVYPWVGGAGKNKLPLTVAGIKAANGGTWSGNSLSKNGLTLTILTDSDNNVTGLKINGTASSETTFSIPFGRGLIPVGDYYANGCANGGGANTFDVYFWNSTQGVRVKQWDGTTNSLSLERSSEDAQIKVPNTTDGLSYSIRVKAGWNTNGIIFYPMIRKSTESDRSFEPNTNICPISGFTEVKLPRTGKNLCYNHLGGYVVITNGIGKYETNASLTSLVFNCKAGTSYTISGVTGKNRCVWGVFDTVPSNNDTTNYCANAGDTTNTITPTKSGVCVVYVANSVVDTSNAQIEKGNQATTYAPYNGTDYIIDLDGTRYGATLDVDSGVMTVTHGFGTVNDISKLGTPQTSASGNWGTYSVSGAKRDDANAVVISDRAKAIAYNNRVDSENIASDRVYSDAAENTIVLRLSNSNTITAKQDFYNYWEGAELCYELATPITVQLTPTEVQMLQGYNVLSANSGDVYLKYDASMIQRIANEKLDISTFKSVVASSSDFADFKTRVATL